MAKIVVGVDGSPASESALRWAHDHVAAVGGTIEVVMSWNEHPVLAGISETVGGGVPLDQVEAQSNALLDATISAATPDGSKVTVKRSLVSGPPGDALVAASSGASLLVVGRHSGGALSELLGSVTAQVVRNAACPTVVVPA